MNGKNILLVILLAIAVAFATTYVTGNRGGSSEQTAAKESAYDRVMRTGTLRCAYILYPKFVDKDPNTGALSGIFYDLMNEAGKQLSLKVEWTEEVGLSNAFEGFKTGRFDINCFGLTPVPSRARVAEFASPVIFLPFYVYSRADDTRFDNDYKKINSPSVKIVAIEGEMGQIVKEQEFPNAQITTLQNLTGFSDVPLQVAMGKADIAMGEPAEVEAFMAGNPGKIKQVSGPPIRMQPLAYQVPIGEESLKNIIDTTFGSLAITGFIARTAEKYLGPPGHYYFLPANSWKEGQ